MTTKELAEELGITREYLLHLVNELWGTEQNPHDLVVPITDDQQKLDGLLRHYIESDCSTLVRDALLGDEEAKMKYKESTGQSYSEIDALTVQCVGTLLEKKQRTPKLNLPTSIPKGADLAEWHKLWDGYLAERGIESWDLAKYSPLHEIGAPIVIPRPGKRRLVSDEGSSETYWFDNEQANLIRFIVVPSKADLRMAAATLPVRLSNTLCVALRTIADMDKQQDASFGRIAALEREVAWLKQELEQTKQALEEAQDKVHMYECESLPRNLLQYEIGKKAKRQLDEPSPRLRWI